MNRFDLLNNVNKVENLLGGIIGNRQAPSVKHVVNILYDASLKAITTEEMNEVMKRIDAILNKGPDELMNILKVKIGQMDDEEKLMEEYYEEEQKQIEIDANARLDEVQENALENMNDQKEPKEVEEQQNKDDLFILVQNNDNFRLQDKEAIMKDKTDRQRNVFERNLKLLEALDTIREVSRKTDGMLQVDLNNMMDLPPNEFELQKKLLSRFKLQPLSAKGFELDRENPERQINLETITKEDLENGDIVFAVPFENLQKMGDVYQKFKEQMKEYLRNKEIETGKENTITIGDKLKKILSTEERQNENIPSTDNARKGREDKDEGR